MSNSGVRALECENPRTFNTVYKDKLGPRAMGPEMLLTYLAALETSSAGAPRPSPPLEEHT
eukprot:7278648-Alexandrium_andersonii.AAC.1